MVRQLRAEAKQPFSHRFLSVSSAVCNSSTCTRQMLRPGGFGRHFNLLRLSQAGVVASPGAGLPSTTSSRNLVASKPDPPSSLLLWKPSLAYSVDGTFSGCHFPDHPSRCGPSAPTTSVPPSVFPCSVLCNSSLRGHRCVSCSPTAAQTRQRSLLSLHNQLMVV